MKPLIICERCCYQPPAYQSHHDNKKGRRRIINKRLLLLVGVILGLAVQIIAFGSYSILMRYLRAGSWPRSNAELLTVGIIAAFSQLDFITYFCLCVTFLGILTRTRSSLVKQIFGIENGTDDPGTERFLFRMSIWFLTGFVIGCFLGWTAVNIWFGRPLPFRALLVEFLFHLLLCAAMAFLYDFSQPCQAIDETKIEEDEGFLV